MDYRTPALLLVVILSVVICATCILTAQEDPNACQSEDPPCGWKWGPVGEEQFVYSIAGTSKDDPGGEDLRGIKVSAGRWEEVETEFGGGNPNFWLSAQGGDDLNVFGVGADMGLFILPLGPARLFPRAKVGLEYRSNPPDAGIAGLAGLGVELGFWLGRRVEIAFTLDREIEFPGGSSNQFGCAVRFGVKDIPWWPFK